MIGLLDERESSSPPDELEEITGMQDREFRAPTTPTMRRLLPDFLRQTDAASGRLRHRRQPQRRAAQSARAGDHRRQTCCGTTVTGYLPDDGGRFELTEDDANAWIAAVNDMRLTLGTCSRSARTVPSGCRPTIRWPGTSTSTSG